MQPVEQGYAIQFEANETPDFPATSCFNSLPEISAFFEAGSLGFSQIQNKPNLQGIELYTENWQLNPLSVKHLHSAYFENPSLFPKGAAEFDHALIMRNLRHQWRVAESI